MRKLIPFAAVLVAVAVTSRADESAAAPVPKAPVPASIDGKYTLVATSGTTTVGFGKGPGKGAIDPADPDGPGTKGNPWGTTRPAVRSETVITRNEITIESRLSTAVPVHMEYKLDPTKTPIAIDVETISAKGKKTKSLGVVEVSGNRLTIALAKEGAERPKTVDEGEGITVYYFQKAPPAPKTEFRIVVLTAGKEEAAEKELNRLAEMGFELVSTTAPIANNEKAAPTSIHFVLKRTVK